MGLFSATFYIAQFSCYKRFSFFIKVRYSAGANYGRINSSGYRIESAKIRRLTGMFKSILLAVDTSRYSEVCTRYAMEYARNLNAHLTVLNVLDRKEFALVYPYYYPTADFPPVIDDAAFENNELFEKQKERALSLLERIEKECQKMGIRYTCELKEGIVPEVILDEAQSSDLVFLGKRGAGAEYNVGLLGSNMESVVRKCDLPIIITPKSYRPLQRILVSYDGSEYAGRALRSATHLCASCPDGCLSLRLLVVHQSDQEAQRIAEKATKYLNAYDLGEVFQHKTGDPAKAILTTVEQEEIDLVAMGAYGHSRIRELVLGSITETVLRKLKRSVLLHH
jgi:nucleotide-binding universal stress UspA family protein